MANKNFLPLSIIILAMNCDKSGGKMLKYFGLLYVAIGIIIGLMTLKNQNKMSLHMRYKEIILVEESRYFKLQRLFGMANGLIVFISGFLIYIGYGKVGLHQIFLPIAPAIVFNLNNFVFFQLAKKLRLIKLKN